MRTMTDTSMISLPYPLTSPPTASEITLMAGSVERQLKRAKRALEIANDALSQIEDANEMVPFDQARWIGVTESGSIQRLAAEVKDLATAVSRKI
jgi:hypothetical protein